MIRFILVMAALHLLAACGDSAGSATSPQDPADPPAASGGTWADVVVDCQAECTAICLEGEGRTTAATPRVLHRRRSKRSAEAAASTHVSERVRGGHI